MNKNTTLKYEVSIIAIPENKKEESILKNKTDKLLYFTYLNKKRYHLMTENEVKDSFNKIKDTFDIDNLEVIFNKEPKDLNKINYALWVRFQIKQ